MLIKMWSVLRRFDDRGEVYVEYVVLGALATLVILAAVQYFFGGIAMAFTRMGDVLRGIG